MKPFFTIAILLLVCCHVVQADEEAANRPVVRSTEYGAIYAKSVPDASYGQKGKTSVYSVGRQSDTLICTYNWFAIEFYISGRDDATLIRFGPWQRGQKPQDTHLAIGIYRNGKIVKEYSTADIQKQGSGVSVSKSHYQVFAQKVGFRRLQGNDYVYQVKGINGTVFTFDLNTGNIIKKSGESLTDDDTKRQPQP